jgi:hypothetical protein
MCLVRRGNPCFCTAFICPFLAYVVNTICPVYVLNMSQASTIERCGEHVLGIDNRATNYFEHFELGLPSRGSATEDMAADRCGHTAKSWPDITEDAHGTIGREFLISSIDTEAALPQCLAQAERPRRNRSLIVPLYVQPFTLQKGGPNANR